MKMMNGSPSSTSNIFLDLASRGARMPIGTDLILGEKQGRNTIKLDGLQLGKVMEESARRWKTPLAFPLMDLTVEKEWLLTGLGVAANEIPTWHFTDGVPDKLPDNPMTPRLKANSDAIRYVATETDLFPCGMSIGPFSLMTKLIADPIAPVFLAGMGDSDEDVERVEKVLELGTRVILHTISTQLDAGAKAVIVCEPAANTVYFSPNQLEESLETFDKYVTSLNAQIRQLLKERGAELIFHDCGELTNELVKRFVTLDPVMFSFGSSRKLWEDASLIPKNIVLFGNLPTKSFYSDDVMPLTRVEDLGRDLLAKMNATGHPFILGSECDVLHVAGADKTIAEKVNAFLSL